MGTVTGRLGVVVSVITVGGLVGTVTGKRGVEV